MAADEIVALRGEVPEGATLKRHPSMPTLEEAKAIWPALSILRVIDADGLERFEPVPVDAADRELLDTLLDGCTLRWLAT